MLKLSDGLFTYIENNYTTDWFHLAMVLHDARQSQGISIYQDGVLVKTDITKELANSVDAPGTLVIGKSRTDGNEGYGSVAVDELMLWDRQLLAEEIVAIATMV